MEGRKSKRIFKKILKIFGWVVFSVVLLLILVALAIQLPFVQNKITQKAISFLEKKIGTDVSLDHISISFPKAIVLEGLYLEDQKKDTLLYAGKLRVDTDLWALTQNEIQLNDLTLENMRAYISRPENDSAYNFSYILEAFASDSTQAPDPDTTQTPWRFSIEDIELAKIRAKYHDLLTGNLVDLNLGLLEVSMDEFDLDKMKIVVDRINLEDTRTNVVQTKAPEVTEEVAEENQPITYDVGVADVKLKNIHANFNQKALGQQIRLDLGESELETDKIDLKQQKIDLESFSLINTFLSFQQRQPTVTSPEAKHDPEPPAEKKAEQSKPWQITLSDLDLQGNSIQFYDFTKTQTKGAVDFDHLWLSNFGVQAENLALNGSNVKCDLKSLTFREKSGFAIHTLRAGLDLKENGVDVNKLLLVTSNSRIQFDGHATFPSLEAITKDYAKTKFSADINQTSISLRDALYFQPSLQDSLPLNLPPNARVSVDARMHGSLKDFVIHHFNFKALSGTELQTSGVIKGLPDAKNLVMNLKVDKFNTTANDIERILPDTLLPDSVRVPEWIHLKAKYDGSPIRGVFDAALTSDVGAINTNGKLNLDSASATRGYQAKVVVNELNIGHILMKDSLIGKLNLDLFADAKGLSPDEMTGVVRATIKNFEFQGYRYANFKLDGKIDKNLYTATASLNDKNLDFAFKGGVNYRKEVPLYEVTLDLKNADFKALRLTERPLKARGILLTKMETADFERLNGNVGLRKVAIFNGDALYAVDSLLFASIDQEGRSELSVESDILSGKFQGTFNIFGMGDALQEFFASYYSLHDTTLVAKKEDNVPQRFNFTLKLKKTELLTDILLPELTSFVPGEIRGKFDSETKDLDMRINIDKIQYSNIGVESFVFSTNSNASELNYNILADKINIDSMKIDGLEFNGTVANDSIRTNLVVLDSTDRVKYLLGGVFQSLEDQYQFSFLPDQVKLNYADWKVPAENYLRFGGAKLLAHNIELVNGREKIIIDSKDDAASTLFVGFRELNLEYLVSMVAKEKAVSGMLHGDVFIVPDTANMTFTADLGIKSLSISEIPWGDLKLAVKRQEANRFDIDFGIQSDQNRVVADGFYLTGDNPSFDVTANIDRFNLTTIEPLTGGQMKQVEGLLTGQIRAKGNTERPDIDGRLNFSKVKFFSTYLNTPFSLDNETISLIDEGVSFDKFDLLDNRNNKATLDGVIATKDYSNFTFRLDLLMDNFRVLNTTERDNELFYGLVDIDATVRVRGQMTEPIVDARLGLSDESHLTYVVPQTEASVMEGEGIVEWIDKTFKNDPFMKTINPADTVKSSFTGLNLTAQVELTDKETFTVIIDPTTGDQLTVKGNTTLTLNMDPTGDMDLTGRYEISEGTYNLSFYKFVKREFRIEKGSTMTWSGDPMNAQLDLAAMYEVETAPIDLFADQIGTDNQTLANQYKQKLPFQVFLNIKGELLKPEISFRLDMDEEERNYMGGNIYARLLDINTREADLNKQVFALLILKRFISDNPFETQGGSGLEGTARTSVSKMLTQQLNRLSENVKGVELSFDVKSYEDYSSGQAQGNTELELGLSKSLFNDKLVVKVAGNVDVEGQNSQREVTDYIGDLALEYMLTDDGRFRITGFRNSNYDMIDGELTETGAGLIYIKDYNLLSELFKANEKNKSK